MRTLYVYVCTAKHQHGEGWKDTVRFSYSNPRHAGIGLSRGGMEASKNKIRSIDQKDTLAFLSPRERKTIKHFTTIRKYSWYNINANRHRLHNISQIISIIRHHLVEAKRLRVPLLAQSGSITSRKARGRLKGTYSKLLLQGFFQSPKGVFAARAGGKTTLDFLLATACLRVWNNNRVVDLLLKPHQVILHALSRGVKKFCKGTPEIPKWASKWEIHLNASIWVHFELFAEPLKILKVHLVEVGHRLADIPESRDRRLDLVVPEIINQPDLENTTFLVVIVIIPYKTSVNSPSVRTVDISKRGTGT